MMGVMTNDGSKKGSEPEPYMVLAWFQAWHHSPLTSPKCHIAGRRQALLLVTEIMYIITLFGLGSASLDSIPRDKSIQLARMFSHIMLL